MKILQIYKDYYPPVIGGIEGHINILAKGLLGHGIDVEVLVSNTKRKLESDMIEGIKVTKAPELGRISSAPINLTLAGLMKRASKDVDLLHFHLPNPTATIAYLASRITKPAIATYHSDIIKQVTLNKIYKPFQKIFLDRVCSIIATSPNYIRTSATLTKYNKKCRVIPIGININKCQSFNRDFKQKIENEANGPFILFIGKFRYYKGLHILIEAMKNVKANLYIVGDGELKETINTTVRSAYLSDKVRFLGELCEDEMHAYLNASCLLVLPSIYRSEAFGIVLLEAMACGKPVISTELGTGTTYVNINRKTGLVVQPGNPIALSKAINSIMENPDDAKKLGCNGKVRVQQQFSSDLMVNKTIDLYKSILGSR